MSQIEQIRKIRKYLPNFPQAQCASTDQMVALAYICLHFGLTKVSDEIDTFQGVIHSKKNNWLRPLHDVINVALLDALPSFPPCDDDLVLQQHEAINLGIKFGLYDAIDYFKNRQC